MLATRGLICARIDFFLGGGRFKPTMIPLWIPYQASCIWFDLLRRFRIDLFRNSTSAFYMNTICTPARDNRIDYDTAGFSESLRRVWAQLTSKRWAIGGPWYHLGDTKYTGNYFFLLRFQNLMFLYIRPSGEIRYLRNQAEMFCYFVFFVQMFRPGNLSGFYVYLVYSI